MADLQSNDPRRFEGHETPVPSRYGYDDTGDVLYRVEGWTGDEIPDGLTGGSCSYQSVSSERLAREMVAQFQQHGDWSDRKFEHYDVIRVVYTTTARTEVLPNA